MNKKQRLSKGQKGSQVFKDLSCKSLSPRIERLQNRKSENFLPTFISSVGDPNNKRQNFCDFMGFPKSSNKLERKSTDIDLKSQAISLADFMGNSKYLFLKKTGFIKFYYEYKTLTGAKKKLFINRNLDHIDKVREHAFRHPLNRISSDLSPLVMRATYKESEGSAKVRRLYEIMNMCDQLYSGSRRSKDVGVGREKEERTLVKGLTCVVKGLKNS